MLLYDDGIFLQENVEEEHRGIISGVQNGVSLILTN